jgi:FixJ family two-component response regulator
MPFMPDPIATVGILDDEPEMRKALQRLLASRGFGVREFASGTEFLSSAETANLDCLLLDLHMPGLNGFDVLEAFQSRHIGMPVVVITAHDEPGTAERVRTFGASAYLKKPIDRDDLLTAIRQVIREHPVKP